MDGRFIKVIRGGSLVGREYYNPAWLIYFLSVTPLKANYMHASNVSMGELKL